MKSPQKSPLQFQEKKEKPKKPYLGTSSSSDLKNSKASCYNKMMDYLAMRDHSETELRTKLARRFSQEDIDEAIEQAHAGKWLADPEELAQRYSESLHQKEKGALKIQSELRKKGLPSVEMDSERELEKAESILSKICGIPHKLDQKEKAKAYRRLHSRGFTQDIIFRALQNYEASC